MRSTLFWIATAVVMVVPNFLILQKETLRSSSNTVFLELAPVDPRSLMQGDYMILSTTLARRLQRMKKRPAREGHLVIRLSQKKVAHFVRVHSPNKPLQAGERLIVYKFRKNRFQVGADAFFFQEGHGKYYSRAQYGEYRLDASGKTLLIGLCDSKLRRLKPPKNAPKPRTTRQPTNLQRPPKPAAIKKAPTQPSR
ncbi:MAG: hypothetical protein EP343_04725 [Deltaproteobacteria bacterium]|nr:MAG: hypothetical protein EP343_04725 [Deltaproteobacteria bacterium]